MNPGQSKLHGRVLSLLLSRNRALNETQNDAWIIRDIFPGKTGGYFVECGASNGILGSGCYLLEAYLHWRGVCVEPVSHLFDELKRNRPASLCFNVCLGRKKGMVEFLEGKKEHPTAHFESNIPENQRRYKTSDGFCCDDYDLVMREVLPISSILARANAPPVIDYLAIDIEGSELELLESFPFDTYTVQALSVECDGLIWDRVSEILTVHGMVEVTNPYKEGMPWERYWLGAAKAEEISRN